MKQLMNENSTNNRQIKALLFDFDGVVIDTEVAAFQAWKEVYSEFGQELTLDDWASCLGTVGGFSPLARLTELLPGVDLERVDERRWKRKLELLKSETLRPGLAAYLTDALEMGLRVAIVSSDTDEWITTNLTRIERLDGWALIKCANGDAKRAKPLPCLYEEALEELAISSSEAIAFEDSPNGIRAAKTAGLFCCVIPNPVTESLDLSGGDLQLSSFEDVPLEDIISRARNS